RVSVHEVTPGERESGQMHTGDLASASDAVAQQLAGDVARIVDQEAQGKRAVIKFGDIMNKSGTMPTTDFEAFIGRIRSKLMQSGHVYANVKFVDTRARIEGLNERESGGANDDPLQEGRGSSGAVSETKPEFVFYLNVNVYGIHRGGTHFYSVTIELTRASDGAIVFSKDYEVKYK
ncbi:MAG: hypothetical protein HOP29_04750, partial [Phycisphaerales bacterium]|nr:hypothetical protein [Phycisphaerales bacterium]